PLTRLRLAEGSCLHSRPHSVPTRRSSDLSRPRVVERCANGLEPRGAERIRALALRDGHGSQHFPRHGGCKGHDHDRENHTSRQQDRKSTRLNSSHEWTSYAVFCSKKKNTK